MAFKIDYSSVASDENLNRYRRSDQIGMKNLKVNDELSIGNIKVKNNHVTNKRDKVIYFDSQVNVMQSAYTDDVDVIDTYINTSFVDYRNLSKTYYTKIGGSSGEYVYKNNKCVDINNNLYVILESDSDYVNIYDSTNNNVPVSELLTSESGDSQDIVIVKYNHLGEYQWATHVGGYYAKFYPSLVCDSEGNLVVCFGNANNSENNVLIYDTTDNYNPVNVITDASDDSSIIVKYDSNGVFQWTVHVDGIYTDSSPVLPRISCDMSGNVFLAHTLLANKLKIYDRTPEDYIPLPTDFFIINHNNEYLKYTQPIYTYDTLNSVYNFVTLKFDKNGIFKWINHLEIPYGTDYVPRCYVDNDIDGNIILSGNFVSSLKVFNPLNKKFLNPDAKLTADINSDGYDNLFLVKFDPNGSVIWCTQVATRNDNANETSTIIDSNSNIYFTFRSNDNVCYLYDTEDKTSPKYETELKEGNRSLMMVKYNKNGVISWYTTVDGYQSKYSSYLAIDNRFINEKEDSNIYLSGSFYGDLNFYNSTSIKHKAYTLQYDDINDSENVFIACFNQDGIFSWATKAAAAATNEEYSNVFDASIVADKDGHVYLMGGYGLMLNIYDSQNNNNPVATLTKAHNNLEQDDIFIIKYNRYGLLNISNPKLLYIEDNSNLPDSFCKEVILTNNDHNGIVNLQILNKENYGYSVRRNVLITESIELITKDGIWIPKIISDQYEHVNDLDVIDTNTKTSFVNYENLQNTFYTRIGGSGYDSNPQMHLDKNDNVYMAGVYTSTLEIYDFTNQNISVGSLTCDGNQSLFITKYDSVGINQWFTKIDGYYSKSEPSIFVNGNGDVFITLQSYDDGTIDIYDVNNKSSPIKTLDGYSGDSNTIFVKYNNKGEFVWNARMISNYTGDTSFTSTAVVTGDLEGNLFVAGYFNGDNIIIYDTGSDDTPAKTFERADDGPGAYFICKFDYTGAFKWVNHLEGGLIPNNEVTPPDYIKYIRLSLNTDLNGNLYLTSTFYYAVLIYNPDGNQIEDIAFNNDYGLGLFTVKYNSSGNYQWYNKIASDSDVEYTEITGTVECGSCVDADGNLYISFSNRYLYNYAIFNSTNNEDPVYVYENVNQHDSFVSIVKYNHNGIHQWNTFINATENLPSADLVYCPVITCDNQYITGQYNPNIYVHFNGYLDNYMGGYNFYNANSNSAIAYTLPTKEYWIEDYTIDSILSKFDANGNFQWATTASGYSYEGNYDITASNVKVDSCGHVYIAGTYYDDVLYVWDVSTNGVNDDEKITLNNSGNLDCYLLKYNKYGLINTNTHRDIYLEDVPNLPDAFEKSIVITNNINNGPVNCQILEPLSSGFGYTVRKNITLVDYLDLISNNGKWIPKLQAEQINISNDLDVIDPNTKLSILNYSDLSNTSWATQIGGSGDERNLRLSCDKDNNVYALCTFTSGVVYFYYLLNSSYQIINKESTYRDLALAKYKSQGSIDWILRIGFDTDLYSSTIYTDAEGNSYVSIVKTNDESTNNIYIYDTKNIDSSIKTVSLTNNGGCVIKFDKNGLYQWDVRILAGFSYSDGTYNTNTVADKNGNVYLCGFVLDNAGIQIWDTTNSITEEISAENTNTIFISKFDKFGKYLWSVTLRGGINNESTISLSCDNEGSIILSGIQFDDITVFHKIENAIREYGNINVVSDSNNSLYTIKYDTNGKCLWTNRLGSNNSGQISQPVSTIDVYGNYYVAVRIYGYYAYIYDTRNTNDVRFTIPIPTNYTDNTFFAKYNKNGIIQWYNFVSGYSSTPSICVDNKFTQGINDNSVYLSGSYTGDGEGGSIYINNSGTNGDYPYGVTTLSANNYDTYISKFTNDGTMFWCSKVGLTGSGEDMNTSIVATNDGHVYLGGEFNASSIYVYQGYTLNMNPNSDIALTINNTNEGSSFDIFLVKYNRYGVVNGGDYRFGREMYLENNSSIPDGTEKTIVIVNNNEYNGYRENICLIVLEPNFPGYRSFRHIWFSEGVTLVSYNGQWFIKSSSNDTLPKRSIIMWGGNQENIPLGWRLCDGGSFNNVTTPDLRGRFILGYNNNASNVNGTSTSGGDTNIGTGARVGTTLSGTVGNIGGEVLHTTTNYEMPTHNHGGQTGEGGWSASATDVAVSLTTTYVADDSGTHHHSISNDGGGAAHNNIPPFYVLAYIMKCF